jgi:hypothetical protein
MALVCWAMSPVMLRTKIFACCGLVLPVAVMPGCLRAGRCGVG